MSGDFNDISDNREKINKREACEEQIKYINMFIYDWKLIDLG